MRRIALPLFALLVAAVVLAGYLPSEVGGPLVGRGGGAQLGAKVSLAVAEDGAWPLLSVRSSLGYPHELIVRTPTTEQEWVWDDVTKGALPHQHRGLAYTVVPALEAEVDDQVRVVVLAYSDALADSMMLHDALVDVTRGGGAGITITPVLAGEGHTPWVEIAADLGYARTLDVYYELIVDGSSVHDYGDGPDLELMSEAVHEVDLEAVGYTASTGDSLYVLLNFGDGLEFEYAYELAAPAGAPGDLLVIAGKGVIDLEWTDGGDPDVVGYAIFRREQHDAGRVYPLDHQYETRLVPSSATANPDGSFADFTYFYDPAFGRWHVFGIDKTPEWNSVPCPSESGCAEANWVHIYSDDHVTWLRAADITTSHLVSPDPPINHLWAPHVILHGGKWRLFFTGVDRETYAGAAKRIERIFYSEANLGDDLTDPTVWSAPVVVLDGDCTDCAGGDYIVPTTEWDPGEDYRAQCRDPFVVWDHLEEQWTMVLTVGRPGTANVAVGVAVSDSLHTGWSLLGRYGQNEPLVGINFIKGESPSAFYSAGRWWVLFTESQYSGSMSSASLLGPFEYDHSSASYYKHILGTGYEPLQQGIVTADGDTVLAWPRQDGRNAVHSAVFSQAQGLAAFNSIIPDTIGGEYRLLRQASFSGESGNLIRQILATEGGSTNSISYADSTVVVGKEYGYSIAGIKLDGTYTGHSEVYDIAAIDTVAIGAAYLSFTLDGSDIKPRYYIQLGRNSYGSVSGDSRLTAAQASGWQYRYRHSEGEATEPDLSGVAWGDWTDAHRTQADVQWLGGAVDEGEWAAAEVQIRSLASPAYLADSCDDTWTTAVERLASPTPPGWCATSIEVDGDDIVLCWDRAAETQAGDREFLYYSIRRVSPTAADIAAEIPADSDPEADNVYRIEDEVTGSGAYAYYVSAWIYRGATQTTTQVDAASPAFAVVP